MLDSGSNLSDLKTKRKVDNNKSKFQTTSKGKTINSSFKSSDIKNFGETEGINKPKGFSSTVGSGGLSSGMSYNSNSQMQFSNDESMKSMLKTMLSYKKTNKDLTSTILDTKRSIINYEKLILQLEKELEYYRELNMKIQGDLFVTTQRKITCEQSESQVQDYCRDLKKKFKVVVAAIEKYESQLRHLKQEKEDLINKYDSQLEDLAEEKFNLTNNQEDLKVKILNSSGDNHSGTEMTDIMEGILPKKRKQGDVPEENFIPSGEIWNKYGDIFKPDTHYEQYKKLPIGVYTVHSTPAGYILRRMYDKYEFDYKVYGLEQNLINRFVKTYNNTEGNLGGLFNGLY